MMIIRQSIYILYIIATGVGKLKTHSPTYCIYIYIYTCISAFTKFYWLFCQVTGILIQVQFCLCSLLDIHSNVESHWIFDQSYLIDVTSFSQTSIMQALGIVSKRVCNESSVSYSWRHSLKEHVVKGQCLTTMLASSRRSSEQNMEFVALVRPNRVISTTSALFRFWSFLDCSGVGLPCAHPT